MPDAYILGIETSCDETAAAVVRSGEQIVSNVVFSQLATHQPYGGVVPELASREHLRALAFALDKPLIAVNHLEGHIHAVLLEERRKGNHELRFPLLALVVSGGHTHLYLAKHQDNTWSYQNIGHTRDDAAGEAFDKVAKLLGLGYPG